MWCWHWYWFFCLNECLLQYKLIIWNKTKTTAILLGATTTHDKVMKLIKHTFITIPFQCLVPASFLFMKNYLVCGNFFRVWWTSSGQVATGDLPYPNTVTWWGNTWELTSLRWIPGRKQLILHLQPLRSVHGLPLFIILFSWLAITHYFFFFFIYFSHLILVIYNFQFFSSLKTFPAFVQK